jgi:phage gpG-like protein
MTTAVRFNVTNKSEFDATLKRIAADMQGEATDSALTAAALYVEGLIKQNLERQKLVDTGNLLNSIQFGGIIREGAAAVAQVGTNVVYAAIHEFGGVIKDGARVVSVRARPYMRPAMDNNQRGIVQVIAATLERFAK